MKTFVLFLLLVSGSVAFGQSRVLHILNATGIYMTNQSSTWKLVQGQQDVKLTPGVVAAFNANKWPDPAGPVTLTVDTNSDWNLLLYNVVNTKSVLERCQYNDSQQVVYRANDVSCFSWGLDFGAILLAGWIGFSMVRSITGGQHEEL